MAKEKELKTDDSTKVEIPSLCAIPRDFVVNKIEKLIADNRDLFEEYFTWVQILNKEVKVSTPDEK